MTTVPVTQATVQKNSDGTYSVMVHHGSGTQNTSSAVTEVNFPSIAFAEAMAISYAAFLNGFYKIGSVVEELTSTLVVPANTDIQKAATTAKNDVAKLLADAEAEFKKIVAAAEAEAETLLTDAKADAKEVVAEAEKLAALAKAEAEKLIADAKAEIAKLRPTTNVTPPPAAAPTPTVSPAKPVAPAKTDEIEEA